MEGLPPSERARLRNATFRLGDYRIDPLRNRVHGPEGEVALQPKVVDLLCALAARHGDVLTRAELINAVWGREFGADESLTKAISQLRKVFGDTRGEPRIIETIPKRGYRLLLAPQTEVGVPVAPPSSRKARRSLIIATLLVAALAVAAALMHLARRSAETAPVRSDRTGIVITIEPFASDDRALPLAGFADDLSAELARSPLVRVRTGVAPEPGGAGTLQYRLRGEIRHMGGNLRIGAQLLDAASGEVIWSESYDRPYDAQFSARTSAVGAIAGELMLPLLRAAKARIAREPPLSLAPWQLTLLVTWVPGDEVRPSGPPDENSFWLQRRALELDPDYAPAHALFAELAAYHALFDPPSDSPAARQRAQEHAARALELAPFDAEVLYQIALYYRFSGDRGHAETMLGRVLELQPHHPLAAIDLAFVRGQCATNADAAIASLTGQVAHLSRSSPMRWVALSHLSAIYLGLGDFDRSRATALASRAIVPMTWTAMTLAAADSAQGRKAEAIAVLAEHRREWTRMNLHYFADHVAERWCLNGPRSAAAQTAFRRLADMVEPAQK